MAQRLLTIKSIIPLLVETVQADYRRIEFIIDGTAGNSRLQDSFRHIVRNINRNVIPTLNSFVSLMEQIPSDSDQAHRNLYEPGYRTQHALHTDHPLPDEYKDLHFHCEPSDRAKLADLDVTVTAARDAEAAGQQLWQENNQTVTWNRKQGDTK